MTEIAPIDASETRLKIAYLIIAAATLLAFSLYRVQKRHQIVATGYELGDARKTLSALEEEESRLRLEESVLTSPERLESLARSLGMIRPTPAQIRIIRKSPSLAFKAETALQEPRP